MIRLLTALSMLAILIPPAGAFACTFIRLGAFSVAPDAPYGTAPRPAHASRVKVTRGVCGDIGFLRIHLADLPVGPHGYRVAVAGGAPPPRFVPWTMPYPPEEGSILVTWVDSADAMRRNYHFSLAITVVDEAGRESQPSFVDVRANAYIPPTYPPRPRRIPPVWWLGAFLGLFSVGALAGWLRRPRLKTCPDLPAPEQAAA